MAAIISLIGAFLAYRIFSVRAENREHYRRRAERIEPIIEAVDHPESLNEDHLESFAEDRATRWTLYQILRQNDLTDRFPAEYCNIEKAAESKLAEWLESPNELGAIPDEMELVETVEIASGGRSHIYYAFRFRMNDGHWAAANGWMLGVVGPYFEDSEPYDWSDVSFSRLNVDSDEATAAEEASWCHKHFVVSSESD